ncbi:hypothetical protein HPB51_001484 [Rhipicephalus microplus]|uniref:Uncharacterized protein n=1 Tax=Rhipicephalus microplus TaxID=6941 RepID=A0A9J6EVL8_RHIMP|nr:hypothetical protein HPB51_001484 [Rhipicephalus microplus]
MGNIAVSLDTAIAACESGPKEGDPSYAAWKEHHHFQKNSDKKAREMEVEAALILFRRSLERHNLRYTTVHCDGDRRSYLALQDDKLTPVERYAMQFLESLQEPLTLEQLKQAEEEIEAQKKDWELGRLKAIKEEEERRAGYRDDEEAPALVYSREDAYTQVPKSGRERRSSRGGSGGVGGAKSGVVAARQVNGTAATPKRVSKRRAAAAVSTTDKGPQQQEETTVPHKKKRALSPVHNHRHNELLPLVQPATTHQRTRHKLGAAPCKALHSSAAGKEEVRPQVANKHPPEHKNQVAKKIKVADKLHSLVCPSSASSLC